MRRIWWLILTVVMLLVSGSSFPALTARAQTPAAVPGPCVQGTLPSNALSLICLPTSGWNGDLVVYAHGYVPPGPQLVFANLDLPGGGSLPTLTQRLGYAFATTSYRQNGLAILEGADDIRELIAAVPTVLGHAPRYTYLLGVSEGGLVTTLVVEQSPNLVSGGLPMCGPIGDFKAQIDYMGDFRVLFDYFFPNVIPGSPTDIPDEVMTDWDSKYVPAITQIVSTNSFSATQLINTSHAAIDPNQSISVVSTTLDLLWYNVFATNDAASKLGGNPYGNIGRQYSGSNDDARLNGPQGVQRISADQTALNAVPPYQTTGIVPRPLVVLHTTADDIIPYAQAQMYLSKAQLVQQGQISLDTIERYGHCTFTVDEALSAFYQLVKQVEANLPPVQDNKVFLPILGR